MFPAKNKMSGKRLDRMQKNNPSAPEIELLTNEKILWGEGFSFVAGVDEAGRGCMAGPVVAAAVIFTDPEKIPSGIRDSKMLNPARRMEIRNELLAEESILWGIGMVSAEEIDKSDILRATWESMRQAILALKKLPEIALIDGNPVKGLPCPSRAIVKGDRLSASIGAASILAKTHRDLLMEQMAETYPGYGFEIHKGYCTKAHYAALEKLGPSPIHRMTFAPVREFLASRQWEQGELF